MILMLWTVLGKDFYKPEMPGLRAAAKRLAVRLVERTGKRIDQLCIHGHTPIDLLTMIDDGVVVMTGDRACMGPTTIATITCSE